MPEPILLISLSPTAKVRGGYQYLYYLGQNWDKGVGVEAPELEEVETSSLIYSDLFSGSDFSLLFEEDPYDECHNHRK